MANSIFLSAAALPFFTIEEKMQNISGISGCFFSICHFSFHKIILFPELNFLSCNSGQMQRVFFLYARSGTFSVLHIIIFLSKYSFDADFRSKISSLHST